MKRLIAILCTLLTCLAHSQVQCIAHRGLHSDHALPNSLEGIQAAFFADMEGTEFDIRHTKDGRGLLAHNDTLNEFIDKAEGLHCNPKKLIADSTAEEIIKNCKQQNGKDVAFFSQVVSFVEENGNTSPLLFIELKDEKVSDTTINNLKRLLEFYPIEKVRLISFEKTALNQLAAVPELEQVKRLWITVLPVKLYKEKKQAEVAADGILFSSRGYAGKLPEYKEKIPQFLLKLFPNMGIPTFTLPTITDNLWRKKYLDTMDEHGLETAVWLNWSARTRSKFLSLTKYVDISKKEICRYLKRNIDFIVTDDPEVCLELRENLPKKCSSIKKEYSTTADIH